ncbi:transcription elongation factor TFIIS [Diatrype stigma]|uniref:Transcription elongation factor n=1 Tax=Diatrype stigma TaxID=117547 RepID=A0AAN9UM34_9PEZI
MMNQRELEARIKALHKATQANEPATSIISLMDSLKKEDVPTEEMLRTTKAGLVVGKLRSNVNKDIARVAGEVVAKWRKGVQAEKHAKGSALGRTSSSPAPAKAASPAPKVLTVNKKKYEGNPETRKFTTDKVDINRTGSKTRDNCIGLLYNGLAYRSRESEDNVIIRAVEVESAAYRAYKGETKEYKEKIRSLFQNLKNRQNAELGRNVMSGALPADRFVILSSKELMSAEQRKADAELEEENLRKAQAPVSEKSISDTFECSNCKQRKVSYTQAQTRSADEPMTTFCECLNCGKRWKFS